MKKALICGISGQDGAFLAELLLKKGYMLYGTSRDSFSANFSNLEKLNIRNDIALSSMPLTDFRSIVCTLSRIQPDEIYNLSGQSSVALSFEQPLETLESVTLGTVNLLEAVKFINKDIRLYNASSGECFGHTGYEGAHEDTPFRPQSPYAVAKAAAFLYTSTYRKAYNLKACSGLSFNHESYLRPERFVTRKIVSAACRIANGSNETLRLSNLDVERDWGWAPEYVNAMYLMLQQETFEDYIIATGKCNSLRTFVSLAFEICGLHWENHVDIDSLAQRPIDHNVGYGIPEKANKKLNWEAKLGLKEIVEKMCEAELRTLKESIIINN